MSMLLTFEVHHSLKMQSFQQSSFVYGELRLKSNRDWDLPITGNQ